MRLLAGPDCHDDALFCKRHDARQRRRRVLRFVRLFRERVVVTAVLALVAFIRAK